MDLIWEHEPIGSSRLAELSREKLGWAKSTMYTRLRILVEKGYVENRDAQVTSLISREEAQSLESSYVVDEAFKGSLPGFLASFLNGRPITAEEAEKLSNLIDSYREK